jgi:DNA-binding MarR family transcriptional regulator
MTSTAPRRRRTSHGPSPAARAGDALRRLVDRVSHASGLTVAIMNDEGVSLPQVLLMSHVERRGACSPSELAGAMHVTLPAVSQMIERLVRQGLLARDEVPTDRRRKSVSATAEARALLRKLGAARDAEYERGLAGVAPERLAPLIASVEPIVAELDPARAARKSRKATQR